MCARMLRFCCRFDSDVCTLKKKAERKNDYAQLDLGKRKSSMQASPIDLKIKT